MTNFASFIDGVSPVHDALNSRLNELSAAIAARANLNLPVGTILGFSGSSAPIGYLLCDGSAVNRTIYAALFAVIGTTYGVGDGSTTFNLPDTRGRTSIGAGAGTGLTNRILGTQIGEENHQLITAELPAHTHGSITTGGFALNAGTGNAVNITPGGTSGSTGNDTPHNNMQPSLVVNFIIKI